jgi:hypothetical protein
MSDFQKPFLLHWSSGLGGKEDKIGYYKQTGTEDWSSELGGKDNKIHD